MRVPICEFHVSLNVPDGNGYARRLLGMRVMQCELSCQRPSRSSGRHLYILETCPRCAHARTFGESGPGSLEFL
eukprot:11151015-Alexandrium_andersonii.AAC.1